MSEAAQGAKQLIYETRNLYHKNKEHIRKNVSLSLGNRRLVFGQTYKKSDDLLKDLFNKRKQKEINVAVYVHNPQVLFHKMPDKLQMDPSISHRLSLSKYQPLKRRNKSVIIRLLSKDDVDEVNQIYSKFGMYKIDYETAVKNQYSKAVNYFVAEKDGKVLGVVIGVDHVELFNSPEKGSSLWGLAVMPNLQGVGVGKLLIDYIVSYYKTKELNYIDLYVDYYNKKAMNLYKKLGFKPISRFAVMPR